MPRSLDLTGQRFGKLTAQRQAERRGGKTRWHCQCDCGTAGIYATRDLRNGDTTSCGCLPTTARKHGHARQDGTRTRTYRIWAGMLTRCRNENHRDWQFYGARGIEVCDRWTDYSLFLADMGEAPEGQTIDRIDPMRGYEPGNCRWLPHAENSRRAQLSRWGKESIHARMTFAEVA